MKQDDLPTVPEFPASLDPHEMLEIVVGELSNPLESIEGWAQVLAQDVNLDGFSREAAEAIPAIVAYLKALLARVDGYLAAWESENLPRTRRKRP
jgi:hypothetical protein